MTYSLRGADNGSATLTVDGTDATCTAGDTVAVGDFSVECTDVGADQVSFTLSAA